MKPPTRGAGQAVCAIVMGMLWLALTVNSTAAEHTVSLHSEVGTRGLAYATGWAHDENSGDGFSYFSGTTFVDCEHTRVGYRQSADIFTGAYAHARDGQVLSYADLGILLQNDDLARGRTARPNKVQLYGQASTTQRRALLRFTNTAGSPQHVLNVVCNTRLQLTLYVASVHELDVTYDGTFVRKVGGRAFHAAVTARITGFVRADGWSARCARCAVRRVNTLAVSSGMPTRTGAYFGIADRGEKRTAVGSWMHCIQGRYVDGPSARRESYAVQPFHAGALDIVDAPRRAQTQPRLRAAFLVIGEGTADERIGLDERSSAARTDGGK